MKSVLFKVNQKVVETLYDLHWAIEKGFIAHGVLNNELTDVVDMLDCAVLLEKLYWNLQRNDGKDVTFRVETIEEEED